MAENYGENLVYRQRKEQQIDNFDKERRLDRGKIVYGRNEKSNLSEFMREFQMLKFKDANDIDDR